VDGFIVLIRMERQSSSGWNGQAGSGLVARHEREAQKRREDTQPDACACHLGGALTVNEPIRDCRRALADCTGIHLRRLVGGFWQGIGCTSIFLCGCQFSQAGGSLNCLGLKCLRGCFPGRWTRPSLATILCAAACFGYTHCKTSGFAVFMVQPQPLSIIYRPLTIIYFFYQGLLSEEVTADLYGGAWTGPITIYIFWRRCLL
jgi:hypothetical protein